MLHLNLERNCIYFNSLGDNGRKFKRVQGSGNRHMFSLSALNLRITQKLCVELNGQ